MKGIWDTEMALEEYWENHFGDFWQINVIFSKQIKGMLQNTIGVKKTITSSSLLSDLNLIYCHKCAILINQ